MAVYRLDPQAGADERERQPSYAAAYNAQEQAGLNDALGLLLQTLGAEDVELEGASEYMITLDPDAGTDFIGFWR